MHTCGFMFVPTCAAMRDLAGIARATDIRSDLHLKWRRFSLFQKEMVLQAVQKDQEGERSAALSLYCGALEHFVPAIHCKSNKHSHILSFGFGPFTMHHRCPSAIKWQDERSKSQTKTSLCAPQTRPTGSGRKPSGRRYAGLKRQQKYLPAFKFGLLSFFSPSYFFFLHSSGFHLEWIHFY